MPPGTEIDDALAALAAALNAQDLGEFETGRVQRVVDDSPGPASTLEVDDGGWDG